MKPLCGLKYRALLEWQGLGADFSNYFEAEKRPRLRHVKDPPGDKQYDERGSQDLQKECLSDNHYCSREGHQ